MRVFGQLRGENRGVLLCFGCVRFQSLPRYLLLVHFGRITGLDQTVRFSIVVVSKQKTLMPWDFGNAFYVEFARCWCAMALLIPTMMAGDEKEYTYN